MCLLPSKFQCSLDWPQLKFGVQTHCPATMQIYPLTTQIKQQEKEMILKTRQGKYLRIEGEEVDLLFITAGISYFNHLSPTVRTSFTMLPRNSFLPSFCSSSLMRTPSLYRSSISEKALKGMSELDNVAARDGRRLWSKAFNLPAEKVFCLISSKVSSRGT